MAPASASSHDFSQLCATTSATPGNLGSSGTGETALTSPACAGGDFADVLQAQVSPKPAPAVVAGQGNAPADTTASANGTASLAPWFTSPDLEPAPEETELLDSETEETEEDETNSERSEEAAGLLFWHPGAPAEPVTRSRSTGTQEREAEGDDTAELPGNTGRKDNAGAESAVRQVQGGAGNTTADARSSASAAPIMRGNSPTAFLVEEDAAVGGPKPAAAEEAFGTALAAEVAEEPVPVARAFRSSRRLQQVERLSEEPHRLSRFAEYGRIAEGASATPTTAARFAGPAPIEEAQPVKPGEPALRRMAENVVQQIVKPALKAVGIDPAKVSAVMEFVAHEPAALTESADPADPATAAGATRAVEQVLRTADLMRSAERPGLNLRLDFGESGPLNVQITLRDGCVHALFRSDSPEIRDTIAQAWTAYAQRGEIGGLPLAEPVLLPLRAPANAVAETSRFAGSSGEQSPEGRSERQARTQDEQVPASVMRLTRRRTAASLPVSSPVREAAAGHLRVHA